MRAAGPMKASVLFLLGLSLLAVPAQAGAVKQRKPSSRELAQAKQALSGQELLVKKALHVVLKELGPCLFTPAMDYSANPPLRLHLVQDGQLLLTLSPSPADKAWPVLRFEGAVFRDVNDDGFEDVVTLSRYMPVSGPRADQVFNQAALYLNQEGKTFVLASREIHDALNEEPPSSLNEVLKRLKKLDKQQLVLPAQVSTGPKP
jgi:hypothetical protein